MESIFSPTIGVISVWLILIKYTATSIWLHLHHKYIFVHSYKTDPFNEYLSKTSILTKKWLFTHIYTHLSDSPWVPIWLALLHFLVLVSTWYIINLYTPCVFLS